MKTEIHCLYSSVGNAVREHLASLYHASSQPSSGNDLSIGREQKTKLVKSIGTHLFLCTSVLDLQIEDVD